MRRSTWCWPSTMPDAALKRVENAGTVFLGHYTPVAVGDYLAGPNHVLPTGGTARFFSPLGDRGLPQAHGLRALRAAQAARARRRPDPPGRARRLHGPRRLGRAASTEDPQGAAGAGGGPGSRGRSYEQTHDTQGTHRAQDPRDRDPARDRSRRERLLRRRDGHRLLRPHARVVREARAVRPAPARQGRSRRGPAPHGRGRGHRAGAGRARGARRCARHPSATAPRCCPWPRPRSRCRWTSRTAPTSSTTCRSRTIASEASMRAWPRTSSTPSPRTPDSICTSSSGTGRAPTTWWRPCSRDWPAPCARRVALDPRSDDVPSVKGAL